MNCSYFNLMTSFKPVLALCMSIQFLILLPLSVMAETLKIKEGTVIELIMNEGLSSKTAVEGQVVPFTVFEDLKEGNAVLIKAGSKAIGTITKIEKAGALGKAGELGLILEKTYAVDNTRVPLRASLGREGNSKRGLAVGLGAVGTLIVLWPLAFFLLKKGQEAKIPAGVRMKAYVDQDVQIATETIQKNSASQIQPNLQTENTVPEKIETHRTSVIETPKYNSEEEMASTLKALLELRKQNLITDAEMQDKLKKLTEGQK
jgi:type IV secretory pathway VirB10-like protein